MKLNVLGPVTVSSGPETLNTGGPKQRTVLAMLISRAGQPLTVEAISLAVYGEDPPAKPRRAIQTYVSSLRSVLGDMIVKDGNSWSLVVDRTALDATRFEDMYDSARDLDPVSAAEVWREALSLWRGHPYSDAEAHGELDGEIARLAGLRLSAEQARIDADLGSGRDSDLVGELEALVALHPYQERFRGQHMLALYRAGRQSDALRSYSQTRELLLDELGVDPSSELQDLERRILEQDESLLLTSEAPARSAVANEVRAEPPAPSETLSTLPVPATALLGRDDESRQARALLSEARLVTLTGLGGSGKTRLAIDVAERERSNLDHGAYFADLSVVSAPEDVVLAVADAVRLRTSGGGDPLTRLIAYMADKRALVVMDNCEHVIDACAEFADAVLAQRGEWRILATSRELLDVDGEQVLQVPPLSSDGDGAAVALFEARARELNPDVAFDGGIRATVRELCERLDGIPLAIELAAARTAVMSPAELLARIDDRFRTLAPSRRRNRQGRRTLEATLDWSYELLDADEQHLMMTLGVFRGTFDVPAAAAVARIDAYEATDLLQSLIAKSLVVAETRDGATVFRLLETVRVYCEERLERADHLDDVRDLHLAHHLVAVSEATSDKWWRLKPNVEAAIDWAIARSRHEDGVELLTSAGSLWHEHSGLQATRDRLDAIAAAVPQDSLLRERLWVTEMLLAVGLDDMERLQAAAEAAAQSTDDDVRVGGLLAVANQVTLTDPSEAFRLREEALAIGVSDDDYMLADKVRADLHMFAGEYEEALALLMPYVGATAFVDASIATLLLLDGRPSEALQIPGSRTVIDADASQYLFKMANGFSVIAGLSHLALGQRDSAERVLVARARGAAAGQDELMAPASSNALIGLAALARHDGDVDWARELILEAPSQTLLAIHALARMVAEQVGVLDEFVQREESAAPTAGASTTVYLREALARWDAQHPDSGTS